MFLPHPLVNVSIVGSLRDREVACSASDRQGSNCESCVWRTVSSQSSHHPQEVLLAQFSLYVHEGGLKSDSFHFPVSYNLPRVLWDKLHFKTPYGLKPYINMAGTNTVILNGDLRPSGLEFRGWRAVPSDLYDLRSLID